MRERFRVKLFFIMIGFATTIAFTIVIIDYNRIKEHSLEDYQHQMKQIEDTVTNALNNLDKIYYYFDEETAAKMEENSNYLLDLYEQNPNFDEWHFSRLKDELGMDVYIINKDNVITHSSVLNDIGMDFSVCCGKLAAILDERRSSGGFYHDGMDIEQNLEK